MADIERVLDLNTVLRMSKARGQIVDESYSEELRVYDGIPFNHFAKEETILNALPNWQAREDDVFIVTYPKTGTTWAQEIMYLAMHDGDTDKAREVHGSFRIPFLEYNVPGPFDQKIDWFSHPLQSLIFIWCLVKIFFSVVLFNITQGHCSIPTELDIIDMMPSRRLIKSHLPDHMLPPDIFAKKAKIIYVMRNPKDMAVSCYKFYQWVPGVPKPESWNAFFKKFMEGKVLYGKWYEHYLGYWKRRDNENILFLKYEDMKRDEKAAVTQICEFLGYHYSGDILDSIVQHTTFESMKANDMSNPDILIPKKEGEHFMRKGVVGDWRNYFSEEQDKAIMDVYEKEFKGTGLTFEFE